MSSGQNPAISPTGATVAIAASTVSANGAIPAGSESVLFQNTSAVLAFVRASAGPATTADVPLQAGGRILLYVGAYTQAVSTILVSGTGTVYATPVSGTSY
jgi:hypothetical protein